MCVNDWYSPGLLLLKYTRRKAIQYSVNIALVFFPVAFFCFLFFPFQNGHCFFATSIEYDKAFLEGFEMGN